MKKLAFLALVALVAVPLAASAAEAPVAPVETPAAVTSASLAAGPVLAPDAPIAPIFLFSCVQICGSEDASCKLDCRFNPYPGCLNDCTSEYNACVAGC